jgi:thioesterase domain-containing protein
MACALAAHLSRRGTPPAGVALLDVYLPRAREAMLAWQREISAGLMPELALDDTRLTAMGAYERLRAGWEPGPIGAPTLLIRASEPLAPWDGPGDWRSSWDHPHVPVDVPGNHFTMMQEHAESTARALRTWLASL